MPCNRVQPPLTSKYMHITPMKTMYRCVCFSIPILHVHIHYMTELAPTCRQLLAFLIPYTSMPCINNIPLPPLPLQVFPSPSTTVTGIQTQSTSSPSGHLLILHCCHLCNAVHARARYRHRSSWHIHVLSLLPGVCKSDYVPVKQQLSPAQSPVIR